MIRCGYALVTLFTVYLGSLKSKYGFIQNIKSDNRLLTIKILKAPIYYIKV